MIGGGRANEKWSSHVVKSNGEGWCIITVYHSLVVEERTVDVDEAEVFCNMFFFGRQKPCHVCIKARNTPKTSPKSPIPKSHKQTSFPLPPKSQKQP